MPAGADKKSLHLFFGNEHILEPFPDILFVADSQNQLAAKFAFGAVGLVIVEMLFHIRFIRVDCLGNYFGIRRCHPIKFPQQPFHSFWITE
jgi:hypothetical protein